MPGTVTKIALKVTYGSDPEHMDNIWTEDDVEQLSKEAIYRMYIINIYISL